MIWLRDTRIISTTRVVVFDQVIPRLRLLSRQRTGPLRIGLWAGETRIAGWFVPHLPAESFLEIEGPTAVGHTNGEMRTLRNFLRDWDGEPFPQRVTLPHGTYRLTLDQLHDRAVEVNIAVTMQAMSE